MQSIAIEVKGDDVELVDAFIHVDGRLTYQENYKQKDKTATPSKKFYKFKCLGPYP